MVNTHSIKGLKKVIANNNKSRAVAKPINRSHKVLRVLRRRMLQVSKTSFLWSNWGKSICLVLYQ